MMIMTAALAVALGLTPVKESVGPQVVQVDEARLAGRIGPYRQFVGRDGKTYLSGVDGLGRAYRIAVDRSGHVDGVVGDWEITFDLANPS